MAQRFTRKDVEKQVELLTPLLHAHGLIPPGAVVFYEHGSKVNGISYTLRYGHGKYGGWNNIPGIDPKLGWTTNEAFEKLYSLREILGALLDKDNHV